MAQAKRGIFLGWDSSLEKYIVEADGTDELIITDNIRLLEEFYTPKGYMPVSMAALDEADFMGPAETTQPHKSAGGETSPRQRPHTTPPEAAKQPRGVGGVGSSKGLVGAEPIPVRG